MKKYNIFTLLMLISLTLINCKDEEQEFDIKWPVPTITSITPSSNVMIGSEITIAGTDFDKVEGVYLDGKRLSITDTTSTQLKAVLPRIFKTSAITVKNLYDESVISETKIAPLYPEIIISAFPTTIQKEKTFIIKGENVDLITSVKIGNDLISVSGNSPTSITVPSAGLNLELKSKVVVQVFSSLSDGIIGGTSGEIEIIEPILTPLLMAPNVLFDFEDGKNPFVSTPAPGLTPIASIDGAGIPKGRGNHYFSLKASGTGNWQDLGYIELNQAINIDSFPEPHITFLVNTNGKGGYFQLEDGQGSWYHFKRAPDDYKFVTNGWEWRSYPLKIVDDGKELNLANFKAKLMFKTANVSGDFEINIDQVMITNGKVAPSATLWNFESQVPNPFVVDGESSINGFNQSSISPFMGNGYYTVKKDQVGGWTNLGKFEHPETFDLSSMVDPHLTFWINTNGKQGYFQLEDGQGAWLHFKFGGDDYKFAPTNGWEKRSISLKNVPWEGSGFNPAKFKPTFFVKTGNVGNGGTPEDFELNLDEVYLSDGPMF